MGVFETTYASYLDVKIAAFASSRFLLSLSHKRLETNPVEESLQCNPR